MKVFTILDGIVAPMDRANVDTDAIIPKQFLKSIKRSGFGPNLFDEWRYLDLGEPGQDVNKRKINPEFVLNQSPYTSASILLARDNFGCGSSREHAPWALEDFGFRAIIAPSFADIFYNNCFKNGILPIVLDESIVDDLFKRTFDQIGFRLTIDLPAQKISTIDNDSIEFDVDPFRKDCLIKGLDDIGLTLRHIDAIKNYETQRKTQTPWLFSDL